MKIISGGQTGVDIAALRAAKKLGVETGGWMPLGWLTKDGPKPEYEKLYNMRECPLEGYPIRTEFNVSCSDGTLRIAANWNSYGELATAREIGKYAKPSFDIDAACLHLPLQTIMVRDWMKEHGIQFLNVAGNSSKWLEQPVELFMEKLLTECAIDFP